MSIEKIDQLGQIYLRSISNNHILNMEDIRDFFAILIELKKDISIVKPSVNFIQVGTADWNPKPPFTSVGKITNLDLYIDKPILSSDNLEVLNKSKKVQAKIETDSSNYVVESIEDYLMRGGKKEVLAYVPVPSIHQVFVNNIQTNMSLSDGELFFSEKSLKRKCHKFNLSLLDADLVESLKEDGIILMAAQKRGRKTYV